MHVRIPVLENKIEKKIFSRNLYIFHRILEFREFQIFKLIPQEFQTRNRSDTQIFELI
jgi:succinate dehydrogenase flavin-adding protein (antitoxin of CptAB toxin-antitoxin module)